MHGEIVGMVFCDDEEFHYSVSTPAEWDRAAARDLGSVNPDRQWILTDRDVWHQNPFYHGPETQHPEDDRTHAEWAADEAWRVAEDAAWKAANPSAPPLPLADDEIPF